MHLAAHRLTGTCRRVALTLGSLTTLLAACQAPPAAKVAGTRALEMSLIPAIPRLPTRETASPQPPSPEPAAPATATASAAQLVECAGGVAHSASALIDPATGGSVSAAGTTIMLPAGAVSSPTEVTLTVSSAQYLEIDIRADAPATVQFEQPALVSLDYSRCRSTPRGASLSVWRIDPETKGLLDKMEGEDDREVRLITFVTSAAARFAVTAGS
jgi:hypothetical protein